VWLGAYRVSRLVAGANPLHGYSYQGAHATNCMKEYFALERQVEQPCFGFKILAAGRACLNERRVREAFKIAFSSIKPIDGVIVGMFPRYVDEIQVNVASAHRYGQVLRLTR
jgi:hypothetical protein